MNRKHAYFLVEGEQDLAFLKKLLIELGLAEATKLEDVPTKWQALKNSPNADWDRYKRESGKRGLEFWQIFSPACLLSPTHVVIIDQVKGNRDRFSKMLRETDAAIDDGLSHLSGVGLILDADRDAQAAYRSAADAISKSGLARPDAIGKVKRGNPNTGVFVLPDNCRTGGLEETLLTCAQKVYPDLFEASQRFVDSVDQESDAFTADDMEGLRKPQGLAKAKVGAIASVLKPGATIKVSLRGNRWLAEGAIETPEVAALVTFVTEVCDLD